MPHTLAAGKHIIDSVHGKRRIGRLAIGANTQNDLLPCLDSKCNVARVGPFFLGHKLKIALSKDGNIYDGIGAGLGAIKSAFDLDRGYQLPFKAVTVRGIEGDIVAEKIPAHISPSA